MSAKDVAGVSAMVLSAIIGGVALLFFGAVIGALFGSFAGWAVGIIGLDKPIIEFFTIIGFKGINPVNLGITLGFVLGFLRSAAKFNYSKSE